MRRITNREGIARGIIWLKHLGGDITDFAKTLLGLASAADVNTALGITGLTWKEDGTTVAVTGIDNGVDGLVTAIDFQSNITATLNGTTLEIDATGGGGGGLTAAQAGARAAGGL